MKIVVALDSFKGSLSAERACAIVAHSLKEALPEAEVEARPMADGGEGTARAILGARSGRWVARRAMGPLPDRVVEAGYAWLEDDRTAVVEMASASGLTLLAPGERNPLKTTTHGTGELVRAAIEQGARRILLAVGGSATVDGGVGAAMAVGWQFADARGVPVGLGGGELQRIARFQAPDPWKPPPVEVLCDVTHGLCGPEGAARVFGPQKGATPAMVERLDAGLRQLARLVQANLGLDLLALPGGGAAGGLAAGAVAFMNAQLVPGVQAVMEVVRLADALIGADWVITGEGRLDDTSLCGKVVSGVAALARKKGARVAVLAGTVALPSRMWRRAGMDMAIACAPAGMSAAEAMTRAEELLAGAADSLARTLAVGTR
ncbi:MAG: glycerate kinase [Verrucomicrobia bacterium]|nr:glycerate kinase [Verrucomicrobiota bacterium]MBU1910246.1 glycerate kinase [Verrucomicrobiota bacterium]